MRTIEAMQKRAERDKAEATEKALKAIQQMQNLLRDAEEELRAGRGNGTHAATNMHLRLNALVEASTTLDTLDKYRLWMFPQP